MWGREEGLGPHTQTTAGPTLFLPAATRAGQKGLTSQPSGRIPCHNNRGQPTPAWMPGSNSLTRTPPTPLTEDC